MEIGTDDQDVSLGTGHPGGEDQKDVTSGGAAPLGGKGKPKGVQASAYEGQSS